MITGPPLNQVSQAESLAQPGEVIVSPEAWNLIQASCSGYLLVDSYVRLMAIEEKLIETERNLKSSLVPSVPTRRGPSALSSDELSPDIETALRAYIPGAILARLAAGQSGWLAELRHRPTPPAKSAFLCLSLSFHLC